MALLALAVASIALIHAMPASLLSGRELGPAFAIITLGASVQSFVGPQLLGVLRDVTGSFTAGWCLIAATTAAAIFEVIWLKAK